MALCTSVSSPLSFSSFHHLLSSSLTDPLIIGPQNKAEILESEKPSLLSMPLEDDISVSHRFIYAQAGELHALMFPLIILLFTPLFDLIFQNFLHIISPLLGFTGLVCYTVRDEKWWWRRRRRRREKTEGDE